MPNTWTKNQLTPFGPVPASQSGVCGREEEGPTVAERALDGSRYRVHTEPSGTEEVAEEARGRWWERMARCVLTSSLGAPSCEERRRKVAALLLLRCRSPYRCSRSVADAVPLQQPAAPRPRRLPSRMMTTVFRDERRPKLDWTSHDPAGLPTFLYCFVRVITRPELSSAFEIAAQECNARPPRFLRIHLAKIIGA